MKIKAMILRETKNFPWYESISWNKANFESRQESDVVCLATDEGELILDYAFPQAETFLDFQNAIKDAYKMAQKIEQEEYSNFEKWILMCNEDDCLYGSDFMKRCNVEEIEDIERWAMNNIDEEFYLMPKYKQDQFDFESYGEELINEMRNAQLPSTHNIIVWEKKKIN